MHIGVLALGLNVSGKKHIARLLKKQWKVRHLRYSLLRATLTPVGPTGDLAF